MCSPRTNNPAARVTLSLLQPGVLLKEQPVSHGKRKGGLESARIDLRRPHVETPDDIPEGEVRKLSLHRENRDETIAKYGNVIFHVQGVSPLRPRACPSGARHTPGRVGRRRRERRRRRDLRCTHHDHIRRCRCRGCKLATGRCRLRRRRRGRTDGGLLVGRPRARRELQQPCKRRRTRSAVCEYFTGWVQGLSVKRESHQVVDWNPTSPHHSPHFSSSRH